MAKRTKTIMSSITVCCWLLIIIHIALPHIAEADEPCFLDLKGVTTSDYLVPYVPLHQNRLEFSLNMSSPSLYMFFEPDYNADPYHPYTELYIGGDFFNGSTQIVRGPGNYTVVTMDYGGSNGAEFKIRDQAMLGSARQESYYVTDYWMEVTKTDFKIGYQGEQPFMVFERQPGQADNEWMLYQNRFVFGFKPNFISNLPPWDYKICNLDNAATGKTIRASSCNATYGHPTNCADKAVDGDTETCMITQASDEKEFVTIDLGETYYVTGVTYFTSALEDEDAMGSIDYANVIKYQQAYISECPIRNDDLLVTKDYSQPCGIDTTAINDFLFSECGINKIGRYVHIINPTQVALCEVVVHGSPLGDMDPDFFQTNYTMPADEDNDGVPDQCAPPVYHVRGRSVKSYFGGFVGKIIVPVHELAENWRVEITFRRNIFNLEMLDCDAKLADVPGNGEDKRHFILEAGKDDKITLQPGDKFEIEFVAKSFKRARGVIFDAIFFPQGVW